MKAVFVDRDGTLNVNTGYVGDPAGVVVVPNAARGVRSLNEAGFAVVVVSNQSGIARGYFTSAQADAVDARVRELLAADGARIDAMYRCPHWPADERPAGVPECDCRKPKPGLLRAATADLGIDLAHSWMVGDRLLDMQAGRGAGCRCVLVTGAPPHEPPEDMSAAPPDYRARDLADAARFIIDTDRAQAERDGSAAARPPAASPRSGSR